MMNIEQGMSKSDAEETGCEAQCHGNLLWQLPIALRCHVGQWGLHSGFGCGRWWSQTSQKRRTKLFGFI